MGCLIYQTSPFLLSIWMINKACKISTLLGPWEGAAFDMMRALPFPLTPHDNLSPSLHLTFANIFPDIMRPPGVERWKGFWVMPFPFLMFLPEYLVEYLIPALFLWCIWQHNILWLHLLCLCTRRKNIFLQQDYEIIYITTKYSGIKIGFSAY